MTNLKHTSRYFLAIVVAVFASVPTVTAQKKEKLEPLTIAEEAIIRKPVYAQEIRTAYKDPEKSLARVLVVPEKMENLHKQKRSAVLKLFLDIVKGGRSDDAFTASIYVIALEASPFDAAQVAILPIKDMDKEEKDTPGETPRTRSIEYIEKIIKSIETSK